MIGRPVRINWRKEDTLETEGTSTTRSAADMRAVRRSADRRRTPARPHLDLFTLQGFCRGATAGRSRPCSTAGDRASSRSAAGAGQEETATPA